MVVTLLYLYGDVLRFCSGDLAKTDSRYEIQSVHLAGARGSDDDSHSDGFPDLVMPQPVSRWVNIIVAVFFFLFNLVGLPTYPSLYDKFLLAVSMVFNVVTIWYAWNWN